MSSALILDHLLKHWYIYSGDSMNNIFGPVPSRRLGISLGIDIVPMKTCSMSCIYCQVGKTSRTTISRQNYVSAREIVKELEEYLKKSSQPNWITFSGSGEPTLNSEIGKMIRGIRSLTDIPICVITNGTLLWEPQVQLDLIESDMVMPSLDSAREETFQKICHPHPDLKLDKIINGLVDFRKKYNGKIWLEILFVEGMNDSPEELEALLNAVKRILPDSIQLNTVVRPPTESFSKPVSIERLEAISTLFGEKAEIIASFRKDSYEYETVKPDDVLKYLKRRPGSIGDISAALRAEKHEVEKILDELYRSGEIKQNEFFGKCFWEYIGK